MIDYQIQVSDKKISFDTLWGDCNSEFIPSTLALQSRQRAKVAIGGTISNPLLGYLNGIDVIDTIACPLHVPIIQNILNTTRELITKFSLTPFDLKTKRGELKHLIISTNHLQDQVMVRFVLRSKEAKERIIKASKLMIESHPEVKVVSINYNPIYTSIIEGEEEEILSSKTAIDEIYNGIGLEIGVKSFFQVTHNVSETLYRIVQQELEIIKPSSVLDLYCGVGGFSLHAARNLEALVTGVEISQFAIESAKRSAERLGIGNCTFYVADADESVTLEKYQVLIVNPPRRGLSDKLLHSIKNSKIEFLIYSSCNPEGQKSEFDFLSDQFEIIKRFGLDMFPNTEHYEALIIAKRK